MVPDVCWDSAVEPSCCQRFELLLMCPLCKCRNCCPCPSQMPLPVLCCAICGWNCSVPKEVLCPCNPSFLLNPLPGAEVLTWSLLFPFYSVLCESFLQPWLYKRLSVSLQLVFSENFPHVDVISDVFTAGRWFPCPLTRPFWSHSSIDLNVNIQKIPSQIHPNNVWPNIWVPGSPIKLIHNIDYHKEV